MDLRVEFPGGGGLTLNPALVERQVLSEADVAAIKAKHVDLHAAKTAALGSPDRRAAVAAIEALEFDLQGLWGFPKDAAFHSHWYATPGCRCDRRTNDSLLGRGVRVVSPECPLHDATPRTDGVGVGRDRGGRGAGVVDEVAVLPLGEGRA